MRNLINRILVKLNQNNDIYFLDTFDTETFFFMRTNRSL